MAFSSITKLSVFNRALQLVGESALNDTQENSTAASAAGDQEEARHADPWRSGRRILTATRAPSR